MRQCAKPIGALVLFTQVIGIRHVEFSSLSVNTNGASRLRHLMPSIQPRQQPLHLPCQQDAHLLFHQ
jgi:hypothetical protein